MLQELVGDKSLERFRQEYDKLHRALKKSHESEKRLIKKCRELNQEIVANAAKVQTALKLSQEDQNTIASLKREIEKAWKMVDAAHEKEQRAKETIQQLKLEITNLSRLVEQGAGLTLGQENTVNELSKQKEELTAERDNLTQQLVSALSAEAVAIVVLIFGSQGQDKTGGECSNAPHSAAAATENVRGKRGRLKHEREECVRSRVCWGEER